MYLYDLFHDISYLLLFTFWFFIFFFFFFFSSRRRHTRWTGDWSSDVCSSDLQIRSFPRNRARQAEKKGVSIREVPFGDALVQGIWEVYNESPVRQGKRNVHYGEDLETVRREEATFLDRSIFIGAFLGETLIGD